MFRRWTFIDVVYKVLSLAKDESFINWILRWLKPKLGRQKKFDSDEAFANRSVWSICFNWNLNQYSQLLADVCNEKMRIAQFFNIGFAPKKKLFAISVLYTQNWIIRIFIVAYSVQPQITHNICSKFLW